MSLPTLPKPKHKSRTDFPGAMYLCAGALACGDAGQLEAFTPDLLVYWNGRFVYYNGTVRKAAPGGWYCGACVKYLVGEHADHMQERDGKRLRINSRDRGPTLEQALAKVKFPQKVVLERRIKVLEARVRELEDQYVRDCKAR